MPETGTTNGFVNSLPYRLRQYVVDLANSRKISVEEALTSILADKVEAAGITPYAENVTPQYWVPLKTTTQFEIIRVSCFYNMGRLIHDGKEPISIKVPVEMIGEEKYVFACKVVDAWKSHVALNNDFVVFKETDQIANGDLVLYEAKDEKVYLLTFYRDGGWVNHGQACAKEHWERIENFRVIGVALGIIRGLNPNAMDSPSSALTNVISPRR